MRLTVNHSAEAVFKKKKSLVVPCSFVRLLQLYLSWILFRYAVLCQHSPSPAFRLLQPSHWSTSSRSLPSKGKRAVGNRITMVTPTSSQNWKVMLSMGWRKLNPAVHSSSSFPTNAVGEMSFGCQWVVCIIKVITYRFLLGSTLKKWKLIFFQFRAFASRWCEEFLQSQWHQMVLTSEKKAVFYDSSKNYFSLWIYILS